ncbi:hypothetical protein RHDC2_00264 [Rhodocyclaceae bacterium]|nr:hypothetical protein RHDC2_00264 [Rhodocyclaceae bacterium]
MYNEVKDRTGQVHGWIQEALVNHRNYQGGVNG